MNVASIVILFLLVAGVFLALRTMRRQGGSPCRSCSNTACSAKAKGKNMCFDKCNCHK